MGLPKTLREAQSEHMATNSIPTLSPHYDGPDEDPAHPVNGRGELRVLLIAMVAVIILAAIGLFIGNPTVTFVAGAIFLVVGGLFTLWTIGAMLIDTHDDDPLLH
jgi:hypothetical protein